MRKDKPAQPGAAVPHAAPRAARTSWAGRRRWVGWSLGGLGAVLLLTQPVSVEAQLTFSLATAAAMVLVWILGRGRLARWAFLTLGTTVVLRYVYWRTTSTLPPASDPLPFALGLILLAAEFYCVFILAVSLIINADPLERPALPATPDAALPTVDVFIPTYNEDSIILATTVAAAVSLDYPADKLTVWLLDDGGTDQKCGDADPAKAASARERRLMLQQLCADLGARYLTRARNEHAKAGNLNNGFAQATGEIVLVLDADHAPFRSLLRETVGHFARDPKLFLVQTPHVFLNPDPIEKNLRTFDRMPSENEMFYSMTQRGLDKWNGSFFCGSAALLRRAALRETGGFSGITITEDCETALDLHARGWTSVFVDRPLIAGLQPETFAAFIGQRSRWCQGMLQILILKNPLLRRGLHPIQKLAYLSSMTFWFFPLPRLIFMFAPLLHIFFDIKIFVSSLDEAMAYTATYVLVNMMIQNYLYGRFRWPWISELYEYTQGVFLAKAIISVIVSPRKPTFNVTDKGANLENDHLSALALPLAAVFALLAAGVGMAAWRYAFEPGVSNLMLVVGLWAGFNLIIAGAALGAAAERRQPDRFPALRVDRVANLRIGEATHAVQVESVSSGSVRLRFGGGVPVILSEGTLSESRTAFLAVAPLGGRSPSTPLRCVADAAAGADPALMRFVFDRLATRDYLALADLMYGDADAMERFLASRRNHRDLMRGTAQFLVWGLTEPFRAASYAFKSTPATRPAAIEAGQGTAPIAMAAETIDVETPRSAAIAPAEGPVQVPVPRVPAQVVAAVAPSRLPAVSPPPRSPRPRWPVSGGPALEDVEAWIFAIMDVSKAESASPSPPAETIPVRRVA